MPLLHDFKAVRPSLLDDDTRCWRRMIRIRHHGGEIDDVIATTRELRPERLVYAEGDSWFAQVGAGAHGGGNLLDAIRTPFLTAVVDVAHVGDEARDMVRGHQGRQTESMFKRCGFDAIVLSAGANDLRNVFADLFAARARGHAGLVSRFAPAGLEHLDDPAGYSDPFDDVIRHIGRFVDLRNAAGNEQTRHAPIFLHGYDYLQPRPAPAAAFATTRIGMGPWICPPLQAAALTDAQMRSTADAIIDELNQQLAAVIAALDNVFVIDQRGLLTPAAAGSTGPDQDWHDELHPNERGFVRLARQCWDVALARAMGWMPGADDLVAALPRPNPSTASRRQSTTRPAHRSIV